MKSWFIHNEERRLRAGWRIVLFVLLLFGFAIAGMTGTRALLGSLPKTSPLIFVILAVATTLAAYLARRFFDRRSLLSLGLTAPSRAWKDLLVGFVLSALMVSAVFATMACSGLIVDITLNRGDAASAVGPAVLLPLLLSTVLIGYWEELAFRGYLLQNMIDGLGLRAAVIVSCLLYGAIHAGNPNAGVLSTLIIVLFGFLRIYGYLGSRLLWLSMGMHIGWNFFQGPVFGYAASGHAEALTALSHRAVGPDWLTGGQFGPESSIITIPVVLLALLAMRAWMQRFDAHAPAG